MMVGMTVDDFAQGTWFDSMAELDAKFRKFCQSNLIVISFMNTKPTKTRPSNTRTRRYFCQRGGMARPVGGRGVDEKDGEGDENPDVEGHDKYVLQVYMCCVDVSCINFSVLLMLIV